MPRLCSFGCAPSDTTMHSFPDPKKFPERFAVWVKLVGGKLETNTDYEYFKNKKVCDIHFTDNDRNRFRRLNILAVPSLHLPGSRQDSIEVSISPNQENIDPQTSRISDSVQVDIGQKLIPNPTNQTVCNYPTSEMSCADPTQYASSAADILMEHNYSSCRSSKKISVPVAAHRKPTYGSGCVKPDQKHVVNQLRSEICRLRKKNKTFKGRLAAAEKCSADLKFQQVAKNMTKPARLFMHMQLQSNKKPKGRRFRLSEKILSLSLYKKSPKSYALLCKYFTLPSAKSMKRLVGQIKISEGINDILFLKIKKSMAEKDLSDRLYSLMFDEMSLTPHLSFNLQKDQIDGFVTNSSSKFADHVLVFMIKNVKYNLKQPVAYYFTNALTKIDLKKYIQDVIRHLQHSGVIVINTVCDQSTVNTGAITELVEQTKKEFMRLGKKWCHDQFCVNGQSIIPLYDTPHLIKGIRNNLLNKHMNYVSNNTLKTVKWEFFQKVYAADKSYGELRLLHKLTEEHIDPDKINKMRVKLATQVFSHSVAVATEHLTARGDLPNECRQLIEITLLLDNLFDSLNVSSLTIPSGKIHKGPVKRNSPHHQLWTKAKSVLKTVKFFKEQYIAGQITVKESIIPSIKNLIKTIEGMEAIWKLLTLKYRYDCLLTRNFNQDPIENFFGNIRSYGVRNVAPNTNSFEGAYKSLLLNNFNTAHSNRSNCEKDYNKCLQNLKFFLTEKIECSEKFNNNEEIFINENIITNNNTIENDAGQSNYVCGWALTKYLKKSKCSACRSKLVDVNDKNLNNKFIKLKEYAKEKKWLCYPSNELENCFHEIQNTTHSSLIKNISKSNVSGNILFLTDIFVTLPAICSEHKDDFKNYFVKTVINIIVCSWCRSVNRILKGKITYQGDDSTKLAAQTYFDKRKHYKNRK